MFGVDLGEMRNSTTRGVSEIIFWLTDTTASVSNFEVSDFGL